MRPQLVRLNADILCLQEVNGQEETGQPHRLLAPERLVEGTPYVEYHTVSTMTADGTQVHRSTMSVTLSYSAVMRSLNITSTSTSMHLLLGTRRSQRSRKKRKPRR